jgi:hypothetical protein
VIVDDCTSLAIKVQDYKRLRENSEQVARFEKIGTVLATAVSRLGPLTTTFQILRDRNIATFDVGNEAIELLSTLTRARTAFKERADSLIETRVFDPAKLRNGVDRLAEQLKERLTAEWLRYTDKRIPATNSDILDVLVAAFPKEVKLLRQQAERLEQFRQLLPESQAAIDEFETNVNSLQQAWAQVGGGDVPVSVTSFLKAAASQAGASLDLYTEEVRRWLSDHDIVASFSIKVSN